MKVKDIDGRIVNGLHRTLGGGLAVDNSKEYLRYKKEKEMVNEMQTLKDELSTLKMLVNQLIS